MEPNFRRHHDKMTDFGSHSRRTLQQVKLQAGRPIAEQQVWSTVECCRTLLYCRVGIEMTKVEVKFEDLVVGTKVFVGSRALPSVVNAYRNAIEVLIHSCVATHMRSAGHDWSLPTCLPWTGTLGQGSVGLTLPVACDRVCSRRWASDWRRSATSRSCAASAASSHRCGPLTLSRIPCHFHSHTFAMEKAGAAYILTGLARCGGVVLYLVWGFVRSSPICFAVHSLQGRMTLLLGPPGAGKTTLLKALAGKLQHSNLNVRHLGHVEKFWDHISVCCVTRNAGDHP